VSVVIPTYGRPDLVQAAVESVWTQKLPRGLVFEIIVVDDGGTDGTGEAVNRLARKLRAGERLRYLWIPHSGPAAARNAGAKSAKGEVLAFFDSDTLAQEGWLSAGIDRLEKEPEVFFVEGRVEPLYQREASPFAEAVENLGGGRWLTCNLFVRRNEFLRLGGFDERFKRPVREDSEFAFRALEAGKRCAFVPEARVLHPVREGNPARLIGHCREGLYEALIQKGHPRSYREKFKWWDGRQVPVYYFAHYAALFLLVFRPMLALGTLALGCAGLISVWCRKRSWNAGHLAKLLLPSLVIPFLRVFYVVRGYLAFPESPEP
jgi:hypothetical protein